MTKTKGGVDIMSTRTSRLLAVAAAIVALFLLLVLIDQGPAGAATRRDRFTEHGLRVRTFDLVGPVRGAETCDVFGGGEHLSGWIISVDRRSWPENLMVWRYGPWSGSWCYKNGHILHVSWGGEPDGQTSSLFPMWTWAANDSRIVSSDNAGDVRSRKWRGHFVRTWAPTADNWPWLYVRVTGSGGLTLDTSG